MSSEPAMGSELVFLEFPDFLPPAIHRQVLDSAAQQAAQFRETGVPGVRVLPSLNGAGKLVVDRIANLLPEVGVRFGLALHSGSRIDAPVAAIGHGGRLEIAAMGSKRRVSGISCLFTFFESPRRFTGGAVTIENPDNRDVRVTLPTANGRMVFAAGCDDLEIGRVQSNSPDFRNSLFVMLATIRHAA